MSEKAFTNVEWFKRWKGNLIKKKNETTPLLRMGKKGKSITRNSPGERRIGKN